MSAIVHWCTYGKMVLTLLDHIWIDEEVRANDFWWNVKPTSLPSMMMMMMMLVIFLYKGGDSSIYIYVGMWWTMLELVWSLSHASRSIHNDTQPTSRGDTRNEANGWSITHVFFGRHWPDRRMVEEVITQYARSQWTNAVGF